MNVISDLKREVKEACLCFFVIGGHRQKVPSNRNRSLPGTKSAGNFILDFLVSRTVSNSNLLFINYVKYFLEKPAHTNTHLHAKFVTVIFTEQRERCHMVGLYNCDILHI
jgi:hypothetical protein